MFVIVVDRFCEKFRWVFASASWALVTGDKEDLVHADMKCICLEGIKQFIHQRKNDFVDLRVQWTPTSAVNSGVVKGDVGSFVKLAVFEQQRESGFAPRLMPQAVELRDKPDFELTAKLGKGTSVVVTQRRAPS